MSEHIDLSQDAGVLTIRMNRPERKNALTAELGWSIVAAVRDAADDDDIWAIAITGNGDAFSSGLDLSDAGSAVEVPLSAQEELMDELGWVGRFPVAFRAECDKPTIAGINGSAVGAGLSLAMCADIRMASSAARFHPGYGRVGLSPDGGLTYTLPEAVGYERAMRFLLELRTIDAEEAHQIGLVGDVVDQADFEDAFVDYCNRIAAVAPLAARRTKQLIGAATQPAAIDRHAADEVRWALQGFKTNDSREAVRAMMAKDQPTFTGH